MEKIKKQFKHEDYLPVVYVELSLSREEIENCDNRKQLEDIIDVYVNNAKKSLMEIIPERFPHLNEIGEEKV